MVCQIATTQKMLALIKWQPNIRSQM